MKPLNMKTNRTICECAECNDLVDISPLYGSNDYDAEYSCYECGKIVCDSCHGDWQSLKYGEDDIQNVCGECYDKACSPPNTSMDRQPPLPVRADGGLLQEDKP
jgi:hypothetical protein